MDGRQFWSRSALDGFRMRTLPVTSDSRVVASYIRRPFAVRCRILALAVVLPFASCKVGPDFAAPTAPVAGNWLESGDASVRTDRQDYEQWWTAFNDPTLNHLIDLAYRQNLTLMAAGTRVLEARATLGVAIGEFYPQTQQIGANVGYNQASQVDPTSNPQHELENYWRASLSTQIAWELDLWGKFRRGVESADASYLASIATYDDVLVTLLSDVATTYIGIRTLQQQIYHRARERREAAQGAADCHRSFPRRHRRRRSTCIRRRMSWRRRNR